MNGIILTLLILTISNTVFLFCLVYHTINKGCEVCEKKIDWKGILTFKSKCQDCQDNERREV